MEQPAVRSSRLIVASAIAGFLLIPVHELGHVICDWLTGHPAAMSYARDYLLSGGKTPFLGLLGGPLLPLLIAAVAAVLLFRKRDPSVLYPIAIIGSLDRLVFYLVGILPSDEKDLATILGWNIHSFKYIFLAGELAILLLVAASLVVNKVAPRRIALVVLAPLFGFVLGAAVGVFGVERVLFPAQYALQFGK